MQPLTLDLVTDAAKDALVKGIFIHLEGTRGCLRGNFIQQRLAGFILLVFLFGWFHPVAIVAGDQKETEKKPWYDARLRDFFAAKGAQARAIADTAKIKISDDVWKYFEAGKQGDWPTVSNLWSKVRLRSRQHAPSILFHDESMDGIWQIIVEADLAQEAFSGWSEKNVLAFGNDIIKSIPEGSIYFGGTDAGRFVITAMSKSHAEGKPFYTITQNQLADGNYLDYVRVMYGKALSIPTGADAANCFNVYYSDAKARLEHDQRYPNEPKQIRPGEQITLDSVKGTISISGNTAVMPVNGLLAQRIVEMNPTREIFVEESYPVDWMYPRLSPNGLIMKLNRESLLQLDNETIKQDRTYWTKYLEPRLGDWLNGDTSIANVIEFADKVGFQHDLSGFKGDPIFIQDQAARKAYSKLRASIADSVYRWRYDNAKSPEDKKRMLREADFAFRQAIAIHPTPEAVFNYSKLLCSEGRFDDALLVAKFAAKFAPDEPSIHELMRVILDQKKSKNAKSIMDSGK